jgi:hypothetical protein
VAFPQTSRHFSQRSLKLPLELMGAELIESALNAKAIGLVFNLFSTNRW